jgi:hypothetical protein
VAAIGYPIDFNRFERKRQRGAAAKHVSRI